MILISTILIYTYDGKAVVEVSSEYTPFFSGGLSKVVSNEGGQPYSQTHQQPSREVLVDVVGIVALIIRLLPYHNNYL